MSNSLAAVHPELVVEWSEKNLPLTPDSITFGSNKKVWWKGVCGHEWETSVKARSNGEKCPICSGARVIAGINDLNTLKPKLASEWSEKNEIKPTEVSIGSHKKVIWKCKLGHEWTARRIYEVQRILFLDVQGTYETLQTVMPKDEALDTVHEYVAARARKMRKILLVLMRIPGLYKKVPGVFTTQTRKMFGTTAGFAATEHQTCGGVWRIDMTKCPYHDTCVQYGCPKLCPCFCDSDDIAYDGLHKNLVWRRTKTLGRGDECCDFCLQCEKRGK